MTYTYLAVSAVLVVVLIEALILKTGLFRKINFWFAYGIILFFQLLTNGYLTSQEIVTYNEDLILGFRVAYAPIEDLWFGFALVTATMLIWKKQEANRI